MAIHNPLQSRPATYLVAQDSAIFVPASVDPLDFDWVVEQLNERPDVEIVRDVLPRSVRAQALGNSVTDRVVSVTMPDATADELRHHPQLIVEEDALLHTRTPLPGLDQTDPGLLSPFGSSATWTIQLLDATGQPQEGAMVLLYGGATSVQGKTDAEGTVALSLFNETDATLKALFVNPKSDAWSLWVDRPALSSGTVNVVPLESLTNVSPGFPGTQLLGWGQAAMRMDEVPADFTGRGIKVAVVDSGAAALTHPDLVAVREGIDLTTVPANADQWTVDTIAHGSHCSGIIAGAADAGGVRGFAPQAEILQARIFPGGRISSLLDALDYCIDEQVDVVNLSLGTGGTSQALLNKISQAKELGVACIVAAGNTGGSVQFPGTSPDVLTVAAMGREGTFPESSYHARQRWAQGQLDGEFFSAQFSCHGPEIDLCGPGVAIVSSVPDRGYAAWDGTSMATPHITGLAVLVLAHHPDFQSGPLRARSAARVDHLFTILKSSCTPLSFGDPRRSGAGMPDSLRALGLAGQTPDAAAARSQGLQSALSQLEQLMVAAGLVAVPASVAGGPAGALTDPRTTVLRALGDLEARMSSARLISVNT